MPSTADSLLQFTLILAHCPCYSVKQTYPHNNLPQVQIGNHLPVSQLLQHWIPSCGIEEPVIPCDTCLHFLHDLVQFADDLGNVVQTTVRATQLKTSKHIETLLAQDIAFRYHTLLCPIQKLISSHRIQGLHLTSTCT